MEVMQRAREINTEKRNRPVVPIWAFLQHLTQSLGRSQCRVKINAAWMRKVHRLGDARGRRATTAQYGPRGPGPTTSSVPRTISLGLGRTCPVGLFPAVGQPRPAPGGAQPGPAAGAASTSSSECRGSMREAKSHPGWNPAGPVGASKQGPAPLASGRVLRGLSPLHTPNRINYIFKRCRPAIPGEPGEPSIMARPCFTSCRIVLTLVKRIFIFH